MIIKRKAELKVAKKIDLYDLANVKLNEGRKSIIDKMYKITPSIKSTGSDCKAFTIDEEKVFMPEILGVSSTSPEFAKRCRHYWQSIYHEFDEFGLTLDISFEVADGAEKDFDRAPENQKYKYGTPVNILDYTLYRYCREWSAVANTYNIYKSKQHSKRIKFYFHTAEEVAAEKRSTYNLETSAMKAYLKAIGDPTIMEGVLRYFERNKTGANEKESIKEIFTYESLDKDSKLQTLLSISKTAPAKFIELVNDDNLTIRTFIYKAMGYKVLTQLPGSSMVMFGDELVGKTMDDAIFAIKNKPELKNDIVLRCKAKGAAD